MPESLKPDTARNGLIVARVINRPVCQDIIALLKAVNVPLPVGDIYKKLRIEQSHCSQHLALLRQANLVTVEPDGKQRLYKLNDEAVAQAFQALDALSKLST